MNKIIDINVPKAKEYRQKVQSFTANLNEWISDIQSALQGLSEGWRDDVYTDFCDEFSRCMRQAQDIQEECQAILPRMDTSIEKAEKMQNKKISKR